jgi:hypothetical protein
MKLSKTRNEWAKKCLPPPPCPIQRLRKCKNAQNNHTTTQNSFSPSVCRLSVFPTMSNTFTRMRSKPFEPMQWLNRYQDYVPLWARDSDPTTSSRKRLKGLTVISISLLIIILIPLLFFNFGTVPEIPIPPHQGISTSGTWTKPAGLTVVALVFYGRRANVQILERYLRVYLQALETDVRKI